VRPYDTLVGEWIKESGETDEQLFVPALAVFLRMSGLIPKYRCAACALGYSSSQTRKERAEEALAGLSQSLLAWHA